VGVPLRSPLRTPNSNPSQARFNLDKLKLQFVRTDFPASVTLTHWDWTFAVFGLMFRLW
jgi:hypothetical protein